MTSDHRVWPKLCLRRNGPSGVKTGRAKTVWALITTTKGLRKQNISRYVYSLFRIQAIIAKDCLSDF